MELIYTKRTSGFEAGKHYRNPRFFAVPEYGVTSVVLEADYPDVAAAYERVGVPVKRPVEKPESKPAAKRARQSKASEE